MACRALAACGDVREGKSLARLSPTPAVFAKSPSNHGTLDMETRETITRTPLGPLPADFQSRNTPSESIGTVWGSRLTWLFPAGARPTVTRMKACACALETAPVQSAGCQRVPSTLRRWDAREQLAVQGQGRAGTLFRD